MSFASARPLAPWQWLGVPMLICIGLTMIFAAPINVYGVKLPQPIFPLAPAFAWAVIRPSVMAPFALVLLGLFLDLYWAGSVGLWPLSLLVAYGLALFARNIIIGHGRLMNLVWYAGATLLALAFASFLTLILHQSAPGLLPLFWQFLATLILYPFVDRLIARFEDADVRFR